jgi:hypothetical protein
MVRRMLRRGIGFPWTASMAVVLALCSTAALGSERRAHRMAGSSPSKTAYLWLWYPAPGNTANTEFGPYCSDLRPIPYACTFGKTAEDCQRQVQAYLDAWYADFNLVFSLERPAADYYPMVVTSDGAWCPHEFLEGNVVGFAYSLPCEDKRGYAGYALECGANAHDCANTIAHEHGHMAGLEHVSSLTDVMNPQVQPTANGFDNQDDLVLDGVCGKTQNSYARMLAALGPWPGGDKPSLFAASPDAGVADASPDSPSADAADVSHSSGSVGTGPGPSVDGGVVVALPGFDALTRAPLPTMDAPGTTGGTSRGGCSLAGLRAPARTAGLLSVAMLLSPIAAGLIRRRARRARPADEPLPCAGPARSPSAARARGC